MIVFIGLIIVFFIIFKFVKVEILLAIIGFPFHATILSTRAIVCHYNIFSHFGYLFAQSFYLG